MYDKHTVAITKSYIFKFIYETWLKLDFNNKNKKLTELWDFPSRPECNCKFCSL